MTWHLHVFDFPAPAFPVDSDPRWARLHDYLRTWRTHVGDLRGTGGDFEDFVEQAARLHAGVLAFPDLQVHIHGKDTGTALGKIWGSLTSRPGVHVAQRQLAEGYARSAVFQALSGRDLHLVTGAEVDETVRALYDGQHPIWIKVNRAKYSLLRLAPEEVPDFLTGSTDDAQDLGWAKVHLEGEAGAFMVYREVPMEYEYRFFIVDGVPVTGAGCIEDHTPLDNLADFDPQVVRMRGSGVVECDSDLIKRLHQFATEAARQLLTEGFRHYSLDVAMGTDGPLVVEINDLLNSGLYACEPVRITFALARSTDPITAEPLQGTRA